MCKNIMDRSITGWHQDVLEELFETVQDEISRGYVEGFYIGRTTDLERRCSEHGCDLMILLYQTESDDHAIQVEDCLIKQSSPHEKCWNEAEGGGGGISQEESGGVYIYAFL